MFSNAKFFTLRRGWNLSKLAGSYLLTRLFRKTIHLGMPASLAIEPTTTCNLRCPECPSGLRSFTRPTGQIDLEDFKTYIDQVYQDIFYLITYFQGEPYLHNDFFKMIDHASKHKIYTSTSTNAHFLNEDFAEKTVRSGLNKLIVSMDGVDQETYSSYRVGGDLNSVIDGISKLIHWKRRLKSRTPYIVLQFLVLKTNEHQLNDIKVLGRSLGVDKVEIKSAQIYDFKNGNPLIPEQAKYSRYLKNSEGNYKIKSKLPDHCWRLWSSAMITWDGRLIPCCFDKDADHQLGSLKTHDFREIWNGEAYRQFRRKVFSVREQIVICQNCTEGLK